MRARALIIYIFSLISILFYFLIGEVRITWERSELVWKQKGYTINLHLTLVPAPFFILWPISDCTGLPAPQHPILAEADPLSVRDKVKIMRASHLSCTRRSCDLSFELHQ